MDALELKVLEGKKSGAGGHGGVDVLAARNKELVSPSGGVGTRGTDKRPSLGAASRSVFCLYLFCIRCRCQYSIYSHKDTCMSMLWFARRMFFKRPRRSC